LKNKVYITIVLLVSLSLQESKNTGYHLRALYLYNFLANTTFPETKVRGDMELAVYNDQDLFMEIKKKYLNKKVQSKTIKLSFYSKQSDIKDPHLLFIPSAKSSVISSIKSGLKGKSVLLVTENASGISKGASINFVVKEDKLKYQISQTNSKKEKLNFTTRIIQLANSVDK
jgi:hypothetical protein